MAQISDRGWGIFYGLVFLFLCINISSGFRSKIPRTGKNSNEEDAKAFLDDYTIKMSELYNNNSLANWAYNTNLTEYNANLTIETGMAVSKYSAEAFEQASEFDTTNFGYDTKRQISFVGSKSLPDDEMNRLSTIISEMGKIYGEGTVCRTVDGTEECLPLEPDLTHLLATSRDNDERIWAWDGWRKNVGRAIKPLYLEYVELKNKLAQLNGFNDYGEVMRDSYEDDKFESEVQKLYTEMRPLYLELHAYIRRKLHETYGDVVDLEGTLPQHLLGDMWGRFWSNLNSLSIPFPEAPDLNIDQALIDQGYTVKRMYEVGEDFFTSMGLHALPAEFYEKSMLEKPDDGRQVVCHATAWDFSDGEDYRIKMCTNINYDDFLTIHHELGHIQYFQQYAHQHITYRDGANTGFHEAVGELMSMSVSTPKHLAEIGLLPELHEDNQTSINFLMSTALSSVASLPFHYLNDIWRWKVFRNDLGEPVGSNWNDEFWKLSEELVGVHRPTEATDADLDCPSIFHVNQDYDMIRYFTRTILQFQFYEALCREANHDGPLHECDIYRSTEAGTKLADTLSLGMSVPWPDALEKLTGEISMDAKLIRSYFQPLEDWLRAKNIENEDKVGWPMPDRSSAQTVNPSGLIAFLIILFYSINSHF